MRKNCKRAAVIACLSLCFAGVFAGCSGGGNTKQNTNTKVTEQIEDGSEIVEGVKEFEVDPNEKAEFSFDGAQGDGEGE